MPSNKTRFIECCCTSYLDVIEARIGGAQRAELCEDLSCGGVTPSKENILRSMKEGLLPINVLIRPRAGDFVYNQQEREQILESIDLCKELGVNGVVVGALTPSGEIDMEFTREMVQRARPLHVTFHRAFDECSNPFKGLEDIISTGCERILTSGQEPNAYLGKETLAKLVEQAGDKIIIMPGGGITADNISDIAIATKAKEYHGSARSQAGRTDRDVVSKFVNNTPESL